MTIKSKFVGCGDISLVRGFTLLEVAVVLVIIGLIMAGVTIGTNLVRAAELRKMSSDSERYIIAVRQFSEQYHALPGDMDNATSIWGARAGGTADGLVAACYTYFDASQTPTQATCNRSSTQCKRGRRLAARASQRPAMVRRMAPTIRICVWLGTCSSAWT